jgi:hypothetical protein
MSSQFRNVLFPGFRFYGFASFAFVTTKLEGKGRKGFWGGVRGRTITLCFRSLKEGLNEFISIFL